MRYTISSIALAISFLLPLGTNALTPLPPEVEANHLGWSVLPGSPFAGNETVSYVATVGGKLYMSSVRISPNPDRRPATPGDPFSNDPNIYQKMLTSFDPLTFEWKRVQEIPHDFTLAGSPVPIFGVNGGLYSIADHPYVTHRVVRRYDPAAGAWTSTPIPTSSFAARNTHDRSDEATAVMGTKIYFIGGRANMGNGQSSVANVTWYDTAADTWGEAPSLPTEYYTAVAAAGDDAIYVAAWRSQQPWELLRLGAGATAWESLGTTPANWLTYLGVSGDDLLLLDTDQRLVRYRLSSGTWVEGPSGPCTTAVTDADPRWVTSVQYDQYLGAQIGGIHYLLPTHWPRERVRRCTFGGRSLVENIGNLTFTVGADSDGDYVLDDYEVMFGTNSALKDTDGDGFYDGTELINFHDPLTPAARLNRSLMQRMAGRFLLQVEEKGALWYVHPDGIRRFRVRDAADVLRLARNFGRGVSQDDLRNVPTAAGQSGTLARRLAGEFLIDVANHGAAWYVDPKTLIRYPLGDGATLLHEMARLATGIQNADLAGIPAASGAVLNFGPAIKAFLGVGR